MSPVPPAPSAALQEPNFHGTYVQLVEKWADRELRQLFVNTTMHYVKVMLNSKLLKSSSSERTLLKNLGSWLGKLTLAKNRPVLQVGPRADCGEGWVQAGWGGSVGRPAPAPFPCLGATRSF